MKFIYHIPLLGAVFHFDKGVHKRAFFKALIAWILVTSPIFLLILLSESPVKDPNWMHLVSNKFEDILKRDGIYVYCASFLTPFLAVGFGRIIEAINVPLRKNNDQALAENNEYWQLRKIFDGYWICFAIALVLLVVTALAYSGKALDSDLFQKTILNKLISPLPAIIYSASVYFWYLAFLDENNLQSDYGANFRNEEDNALNKFKELIQK